MKNKNDEMVVFNVKISRGLHKRLKLEAVNAELTIQEIVRRLIEGYLDVEREKGDVI